MSGSFTKYERLGAYHWRGLDHSLRGLAGPFSLFDHSRYGMILEAVGSEPRRVLEVGCGDGALCHTLARAGHEVLGVDLEPRAVELAQAETAARAYRVRPKFLCADLFETALDLGEFDVVVLADVLEHLEEQEAFVNRLLDFLKLGGRLVITTPLRRAGRKWDECHTREFDQQELETFLLKFPGRSRVQAWLPQTVFEIYGRRWGRIALNVASLAFNPFLLPSRRGAVMLLGVLEPTAEVVR